MNKQNMKKTLVIDGLNRGFEDIKPIRKKEFVDSIRKPRISTREFLLTQIGFISKVTWIFSFALTFGAIVIIAALGNINGQEVWNIGAISPFLAMISLMELTKSDSFKMTEIEESCLYSRHQLILSRLVILGFANIGGILLIAFVAKLSLGENMLQVLLYLMIPYMLTCLISLNILKKSRIKETNILCSIVSAAVAISYMIISNFYRLIFEIKYISIVGIVAVILAFFTINVIKGYRYPKEEYYGA